MVAAKRNFVDSWICTSGAMTSRYRNVPRDNNAFLVPAPG